MCLNETMPLSNRYIENKHDNETLVNRQNTLHRAVSPVVCTTVIRTEYQRRVADRDNANISLHGPSQRKVSSRRRFYYSISTTTETWSRCTLMHTNMNFMRPIRFTIHQIWSSWLLLQRVLAGYLIHARAESITANLYCRRAANGTGSSVCVCLGIRLQPCWTPLIPAAFMCFGNEVALCAKVWGLYVKEEVWKPKLTVVCVCVCNYMFL